MKLRSERQINSEIDWLTARLKALQVEAAILYGRRDRAAKLAMVIEERDRLTDKLAQERRQLANWQHQMFPTDDAATVGLDGRAVR